MKEIFRFRTVSRQLKLRKVSEHQHYKDEPLVAQKLTCGLEFLLSPRQSYEEAVQPTLQLYTKFLTKLRTRASKACFVQLVVGYKLISLKNISYVIHDVIRL